MLRNDIGLKKPDLPILEVVDQLCIGLIVHLARPDHLAAVYVGVVVYPFLIRRVAPRIADYNQLFTASAGKPILYLASGRAVWLGRALPNKSLADPFHPTLVLWRR